jgi:hypothetical protein
MSKSFASRTKFEPARGSLPVLQYCSPEQLQIDEQYQRSLETDRSESLIRRIAAHWDWGLCQPLFVARRGDGGLFVVDGQHRLAAARLRADIWQLPCVVTGFDTPAAEAEAFVQLNQQRRPLTQLELFKAALASGDPEAKKVVQILERNGLRLANSTNNQSMKVGDVANIAGLRTCLRVHGELALDMSSAVLAKSWPGQVLRYAGSIFPGIAAVVSDEIRLRATREEIVAGLSSLLSPRDQAHWFRKFAVAISQNTNLKRSTAAINVIREAWRARLSAGSTGDDLEDDDDGFVGDLRPAEITWCEQCDQRVSGAKVAACASAFCSLKRKAA